MIIYSCDFVVASELFYGLNALWEAFAASNPPFSWGDNNRTLVVAVDIYDHLEPMDVLGEQLDMLKKRIDHLPEQGQTYVDLEN